MIIIRNLTKSIVKDSLFEDLSVTIQSGEKIGIVGPNGGGKSTLLKIIAGVEIADAGVVDTGDERIAYLPQEIIFATHDTVQSFLSEQKHKIDTVLHKVGLETIQHNQLVRDLSGGQKTKLALAKVLLNNPSCLLLDEPTNHLDSSALLWLRDFILHFYGSVIIVSHDRALLNSTVNRIIEIDSINREVNEFTGNYDAYISEKQARFEKRNIAYGNQEKKRKHLEEWIRHRQDIASAVPNPAMGKQIQMMKRRLQREIVDQEISRPKEYKSISTKSLAGDIPNSKLVLRFDNVLKRFNDRVLLHDVSFEMRGADRVVLRGDNGSGKTTLLKLITGELQPDEGLVTLGTNINIGYFAQEHDLLDFDKTVEQEFLSTPRLQNLNRNIRTVLGSFLFTGDDVYTKVGSLSFGQRARLVFAKLMNQNNELLVLDEPTNHLDIISRECIEAALNDYGGSLLVVSHDEYFVERIAINTVFVLDKGKIKKK